MTGFRDFCDYHLYTLADFFTLISDGKCKSRLLKSSFLELLYIPTLIGLGLVSLTFKGLFKQYHLPNVDFISLKDILGYSISLFLFGVCLLSVFLEFSPQFEPLIKKSPTYRCGNKCSSFFPNNIKYPDRTYSLFINNFDYFTINHNYTQLTLVR